MSTKANSNKRPFSRRKFLRRTAVVLGGSIVAGYLGCSPTRRYLAQTVEGMDFPAVISSMKPDFWFQVLSDNSILFKSPKIEMGQNVITGLAMLAAEELEIPLERIKVEHASTGSGIVDSLGTGGSNSTLALYIPVREVAATMREMLKTAAAEQWGVPLSSVAAKDGVLSSGNKSMTYAEIAESTTEWKTPKTPALKPSSAFKYVGKTVKRLDLQEKVMGTALYTIDHERNGLLHAVTLECPYLNGKIKSIDTTEAAKMPDVVKVIQEDDLLAVVATNRYAAEMAVRKIKVEWDIPKAWQQKEIIGLVTVGKGKPVNVQDKGSARSILSNSKAKIFEQAYRTPMAAHAQMETYGTLAHIENDEASIVIGTQAPGMIQGELASAMGMKKNKVDVQAPYLGGGFGRKMGRNNATQAARISKIVGAPIKLIPTREQEFQNSVYRPNTHHVLKAVFDEQGELEAISHDQATPDMVMKNLGGNFALSMVGADWLSAGHGASIMYPVKNRSASVWNVEVPYLSGIWRSVGIFANTFAIESFVNELAHHTKQDPIEMRLKLLKGGDELNQRMSKVLEVLKDKADWSAERKPGVGRSVAICNDRKTIAAAAIEVSIVDGAVKVLKVTEVVDCGIAINPGGIHQQVEGAIMMGISAALYEEITIADGKISASNYHEYPLATLNDVPEIQVVILENAPEPFGIGEPPLGPVAPAIAGALLDLTGKALRSLPLRLSEG
ncbi:molybdopterin cofactor-binding domain-containing protein [Haliscomenobacter sp.]|uniref:xanthine dehydrogenase family protein molybdopterin-binding subunit n=1 Tax=Haliscomenobacter sp. TaxID=2717303 RepID=UPI003BABD379